MKSFYKVENIECKMKPSTGTRHRGQLETVIFHLNNLSYLFAYSEVSKSTNFARFDNALCVNSTHIVTLDKAVLITILSRLALLLCRLEHNHY